MQLKRNIKSWVVMGAALMIGTVLSGQAKAAVGPNTFTSPFPVDGAIGFLANYDDGQWLVWFRWGTNNDCSQAVMQYVAPSSGFTGNVFIYNGVRERSWEDQIYETETGNICGYQVTSGPVHNGYGLYLMGGAGGDSLHGIDTRTYLYGGTGNDYLYASGATWYLQGQDGDDTLVGCSSSNNGEYYYGGNGTDWLQDKSGAWSVLSSVEIWAGTGC